MRKKTNLSSFPHLMLCAFFVLASSCEKEESAYTYKGKTTAVFHPDVSYGTMTDQDGNIYKTVTIGTQTWMAENLRTITYNDGTPIPHVTNGFEWYYLTTHAYCKYNDTMAPNIIATYGRLYNGYAVNTGKLAPDGWHIPTQDEWDTLISYLGGYRSAGGKLKETGTTHWDYPNTGATNETGFTALPGGLRSGPYGTFGSIGYYGGWWSATDDWYWSLNAENSIVLNHYFSSNVGLSVRCVKD